jgi:hypothetical protein
VRNAALDGIGLSALAEPFTGACGMDVTDLTIEEADDENICPSPVVRYERGSWHLDLKLWKWSAMSPEPVQVRHDDGTPFTVDVELGATTTTYRVLATYVPACDPCMTLALSCREPLGFDAGPDVVVKGGLSDNCTGPDACLHGAPCTDLAVFGPTCAEPCLRDADCGVGWVCRALTDELPPLCVRNRRMCLEPSAAVTSCQ